MKFVGVKQNGNLEPTFDVKKFGEAISKAKSNIEVVRCAKLTTKTGSKSRLVHKFTHEKFIASFRPIYVKVGCCS